MRIDLMHIRCALEKTGDVVYPITAGIVGKQLYTASVSVVGVLNLNLGELVDFDRGFISDTSNSLCC